MPPGMVAVVRVVAVLGAGMVVVNHAPELQAYDAPGVSGHVRRMRDHNNGAAFFVQLVKNIQNRILVGFVQIPGGFVGQNEFGVVDEGAGNAQALLFSA
jgi:hypothetical protein